jgi:hypothetical protein
MKKQLKIVDPVIKRQGRLLAYGMTGAMALALAACSRPQSEQMMVAPPNNFTTNQAPEYASTNQAPVTAYVHSGGGCSGYLCGHGYYPIYGYPGYYYRPAPGSTVEMVSGGSSSYAASSPAEARASVARGGFGSTGRGGSGE